MMIYMQDIPLLIKAIKSAAPENEEEFLDLYRIKHSLAVVYGEWYDGDTTPDLSVTHAKPGDHQKARKEACKRMAGHFKEDQKRERKRARDYKKFLDNQPIEETPF